MTSNTNKLSFFRALLILIFPALVLLPSVFESAIAIKSIQNVIGAFSVTILLGLIVGAGLLVLKKFSRKLPIRLLFVLSITGLVCVYIDLMLFPHRGLLAFVAFGDGVHPLATLALRGVVVLAVFAVLVGLIWKYEDQTIDALVILFAVSLFSAILFSGNATPNEQDRSAETVAPDSETGELSIYIIFDGMIGSAGLRTEIVENAELANEIDAFYYKYGFHHYPRAFSRHIETRFSIPAMLNGLSVGVPDLKEVISYERNSTTLTQNRIFDQILAQERPIHVYQTQYINFCSHEAVASCNTLTTADFLSPHIPSAFRTSSELLIGLFTLEAALKQSIVTQRITGILFRPIHSAFRKLLPRQYKLLYSSSKNNDLTFDSWFGQFAEDIVSSKGDVHFGHFIVPHFPFRLNAQCELVMEQFSGNRGERYDRLVEDVGLSPDQAAQKRKELYGEYREQVRCVYRKLTDLFEELKRQGRYDGATITLMGDHGSRISNAYFRGLASDGDLVDNHSTLFAVKDANNVAQDDPQMISVQQLLMAHQRKDEAGLATIEDTIVFTYREPEPYIGTMPPF